MKNEKLKKEIEKKTKNWKQNIESKKFEHENERRKTKNEKNKKNQKLKTLKKICPIFPIVPCR